MANNQQQLQKIQAIVFVLYLFLNNYINLGNIA